MNQQQAARFQSRVKDCMVAFRPALVPLFTQRRKRPELVGTAVAVGTKPERLLLTAAHVIREFDGDTIITPSGRGWAEIEGQAITVSTTGYKSEDDDRIDAGAIVLTEESSSKLNHFLDPSLILRSVALGERDWFILAGFPCSKVKYQFPKQSVSPRALPVIAKSISHGEYGTYRAEVGNHFVIEFNHKQAVQGGKRVTAPSVRGVSGGMLLWAPGITDPKRVSETKLAGIFIEWPAPARVLISTHVGIHREMLRRERPDIQF